MLGTEAKATEAAEAAEAKAKAAEAVEAKAKAAEAKAKVGEAKAKAPRVGELLVAPAGLAVSVAPTASATSAVVLAAEAVCRVGREDLAVRAKTAALAGGQAVWVGRGAATGRVGRRPTARAV